MSAALRYLSYVIRHKWFVLQAGVRVGAPLWRLVIHDWSKFTPAEWGAYVRNFYGLREDAWVERETSRMMPVVGYVRGWALLEAREAWDDEKRERAEAFDRAWLHHQHANPHHWQHWMLREDSGATKLLEMPTDFAREMVADWMGAGRAITGRWEAADWYAENREVIQLHPGTRAFVERLLREQAAVQTRTDTTRNASVAVPSTTEVTK